MKKAFNSHVRGHGVSLDAITISETDEHQSASSNDKRLHLALLVRIGMPILTKLASVIFGLERIPDLLSFAFKREF